MYLSSQGKNDQTSSSGATLMLSLQKLCIIPPQFPSSTEVSVYPFTYKNTLEIPLHIEIENGENLAGYNQTLAEGLKAEGATVTIVDNQTIFFQAGLFGSGFFPKSGSLNRVLPFDRGEISIHLRGEFIDASYQVRMYQGFMAALLLSVMIFLLESHVKFPIFGHPIISSLFPMILLTINRSISIGRFEGWISKMLNQRKVGAK
jgi:hypothetical protein